MNKLHFITVLILLCNTSYAQITLTAAGNNPEVGDTVYSHSLNNIVSGSGGPNLTWDYSSYNITTTVWYVVKDTPISACGIATAGNIFLKSASGQYCDEYLISADSIALKEAKYIGAWSYSYSNAKTILKYPLTYNNQVYSDSFQQTYHANFTSGYQWTKGLATINADAYGTLILPDTSFTNTLRVKTVSEGVGSILPSPDTYNFQNTTYEWYVENVPMPVFSSISNSPTSVSSIENSSPGILIYPNPATSELTIKTEKPFTSYTITNSIGQVMMKYDMNSMEAKVDIKSLATGMYYISLNGEQGSEVRKFVKV